MNKTGLMWIANPTFRAMGAFYQFDYTGEMSPFKERLTRCYELAAKAFIDWPGRDDYLTDREFPIPETLVHGMWQGPEPVAIGHAWVVLSDGSIWEPISAMLCNGEEFYSYTRGTEVESYTETTAKINMLTTGHFGPWRE